MQEYECESCGYRLAIPEKAEEPRWCPNCRGKMYAVEGKAEGELVERRCPDCGYIFYTAPGAREPYKCPSCNFTLAPVPGRRGVYRL